MSWKKILSLCAFFAVFFSVLRVKQVAAAEVPACNLNRGKFNAIGDIQSNGSLDYLQKIKSELALRQELLAETVDCAVAEARQIKANIDAVHSGDRDTQKLQAEYSGELGDAVNYYELQKSKIGDLGLQGSKNFAADLAAWRSGNYEPLAGRADNFVLWTQNQIIMRATQERLNQVGQTVTLLNLVGENNIQELWQKANGGWQSAVRWNEAAKASLLSFGPPEESLNDIKMSLTALSATYQNFFDILSSGGTAK